MQFISLNITAAPYVVSWRLAQIRRGPGRIEGLYVWERHGELNYPDGAPATSRDVLEVVLSDLQERLGEREHLDSPGG